MKVERGASRHPNLISGHLPRSEPPLTEPQQQRQPSAGLRPPRMPCNQKDELDELGIEPKTLSRSRTRRGSDRGVLANDTLYQLSYTPGAHACTPAAPAVARSERLATPVRMGCGGRVGGWSECSRGGVGGKWRVDEPSGFAEPPWSLVPHTSGSTLRPPSAPPRCMLDELPDGYRRGCGLGAAGLVGGGLKHEQTRRGLRKHPLAPPV